MWTTENRAKYDRSGLRYPSDLTDAEWLLIAADPAGQARRDADRLCAACHYVFDMWMVRNFPHTPFKRYADGIICPPSTRRRGAGTMERPGGTRRGLQAGSASAEDEAR